MRREFTTTKPNVLSKYFGGAIIIACVTLMVLFFHTHQSRVFFEVVRSFGFFGVVLSILILAISNMFPIPGEFITINLLEIYGIKLGFIYSCAGSVVGAIFAYFAARFISQHVWKQVNHSQLRHAKIWIHKNEAIGLLVLRFIPFVPYEMVNYLAGILGLDVFTFIWTTTIGILPYQLAVAGMYSGVFGGHFIRGIFGITLFILLAISGWIYKMTHQQKSRLL